MIGEAEEDVYPSYSKDRDLIDESYLVMNFNNYVYFGTIIRSMYTLFCIVIMAEWPEIGRPLVERQPAMFIFFTFFIIFTTFGVMNVIIGVIVDNTMEAAKAMQLDDEERARQEKLAQIGKIRDLVFSLDADNSGTITEEEVVSGWNFPELHDMLALVELPKGFNPHELMTLLDSDGDGNLTLDEFMKSFFRLIDNNPFQQNCCMHASLNEIKKDTHLIREGLASISNETVGLRER